MDPAQARALRQLVRDQTIAALGTLHQGQPYVSMVPYALLPAASALVIHVSGLSSHTKDMLESPRVSLLIVAPHAPGMPAQALARVTIQGEAEHYQDSTDRHLAARQAYLARFPQAAHILELPDFRFFGIRPISIRFIAGFAQASNLTPEAFATALTET